MSNFPGICYKCIQHVTVNIPFEPFGIGTFQSKFICIFIPHGVSLTWSGLPYSGLHLQPCSYTSFQSDRPGEQPVTCPPSSEPPTEQASIQSSTSSRQPLRVWTSLKTTPAPAPRPSVAPRPRAPRPSPTPQPRAPAGLSVCVGSQGERGLIHWPGHLVKEVSGHRFSTAHFHSD